MWRGILKKVALLGWLIERIRSDVALKTRRSMAAAVSKTTEVSEAEPIVRKILQACAFKSTNSEPVLFLPEASACF
jgi:hypothetical protein